MVQPLVPPPPGVPSRPQSHGGAVTALVVGLVSLLLLPILAPVAWVLGNRALKEIDAEPWRWSNRGLALAGKVLGIIVTIMLAIVVAILVIVIAWVVPGMGSGKSGPQALTLVLA